MRFGDTAAQRYLRHARTGPRIARILLYSAITESYTVYCFHSGNNLGGVSFFNNSNNNRPIETKLGTHGYFANPRYDSGFRKDSRAQTWVTMVTGFLRSVVNKK